MGILQLIINGLLLGGVYALLGIGMSILFGIVGLTNLSHGEFVILGAYAGALLTQFLGVNPLLTLLITILLAIVKYVGRDEDEEESDSEEERQTVSTWRLLLSLGITILAAVIFFLTEDLTNTMALVDRWTLLMLIILAVQGIGYYRATHQKEDRDPEDPQQPLPDRV